MRNLYDEVAGELADAKFSKELEANIRVCKHRISINYRHPFAVYDGGDSARMIEALAAVGMQARLDGVGLMVQLR